ncbi:MAG: UDP-N-acetylmuramoyl-L-alanyl-D-glutamate--2,6-diaminopimelate ligase, partial [Acidimicrobiaceae bacterium]|nr:UDP-N-acetylmuramoyl-L-alanyl-D-glutamate--2,6-diaminopimelate ligase [Acidimicrobiaceae bacterium]
AERTLAAELSDVADATDLAEAVVESTRVAMAPVAASFYGHPSRSLAVVGITGTNGKTTTTQLTGAILRAAGRVVETMGNLHSGGLNTPEAPELQGMLAAHRDAGVDAVAMEVSSHALAQHRVDAIEFAAAVFTNLTRDHLDFHGTMEDYFAAKARLFEKGRSALGVANADDAFGARLLQSASIPTHAYSVADAEGLEFSPSGSRFRWRGVDVALSLPGRFNVLNALAAATAASAMGVDHDAVAAGLASVQAVHGRFDRIDVGQQFTVLIDYAHTPDALEQVLRAAREMTRPAGLADEGRVILVFGCGGDRDRGKRPEMGRLAASVADVAVLTSDNPRSEDPMAIIDEVLAGAPGALVVEPDRAAAIALAVGRAEAGDVVVIAGKGHETGQIVGDTVLPFDDHDAARAALESLTTGGPA